MTKSALAAEFATPDREQWLGLVQGVLRKSGADLGGRRPPPPSTVDVT
ncbi:MULTISPECIES: hypothetical protein [Saccharothrix]|nr:hypothetical protein [Saccharothrix sp. CB00851]